MYNFTIPKEQLSDLWRLREFAACGPIAKQIRQAISDYLKKIEKEKIGCPIKDIEETTRRHEREVNQDDWRVKLQNQIEDRDRRLSKKLY